MEYQYEFFVSILKIRSDPNRTEPNMLSIEWITNTNSPYPHQRFNGFIVITNPSTDPPHYQHYRNEQPDSTDTVLKLLLVLVV